MSPAEVRLAHRLDHVARPRLAPSAGGDLLTADRITRLSPGPALNAAPDRAGGIRSSQRRLPGRPLADPKGLTPFVNRRWPDAPGPHDRLTGFGSDGLCQSCINDKRLVSAGLTDGPLYRCIADANDRHRAADLAFDPLADAEAWRRVAALQWEWFSLWHAGMDGVPILLARQIACRTVLGMSNFYQAYRHVNLGLTCYVEINSCRVSAAVKDGES